MLRRLGQRHPPTARASAASGPAWKSRSAEVRTTVFAPLSTAAPRDRTQRPAGGERFPGLLRNVSATDRDDLPEPGRGRCPGRGRAVGRLRGRAAGGSRGRPPVPPGRAPPGAAPGSAFRPWPSSSLGRGVGHGSIARHERAGRPSKRSWAASSFLPQGRWSKGDATGGGGGNCLE